MVQYSRPCSHPFHETPWIYVMKEAVWAWVQLVMGSWKSLQSSYGRRVKGVAGVNSEWLHAHYFQGQGSFSETDKWTKFLGTKRAMEGDQVSFLQVFAKCLHVIGIKMIEAPP